MRYRFIRNHREVFPVGLMCQVLELAEAGFMRDCNVLKSHEAERTARYWWRSKPSISAVGRPTAVPGFMQIYKPLS